MKNFLLIIFLSLMSLLGVKSMDCTLQEEERMEVENIFHADIPLGYVQSSVIELPDDSGAYVVTDSLARQYRVCGRGQRSFSVNHSLWGKSAVLRTAKKHFEMLSNFMNCAYTSLPSYSWKVASEHYVFGLRRILI